MVQSKVITAEQRDEALKQPISVSKTLASAHAQYFIDWLDKDIRSLVDPKIPKT